VTVKRFHPTNFLYLMHRILTILFFLPAALSAQSWQWAKTGSLSHTTESSTANSVVTDATGNVYVAGSFASQSITFGSITLNNAGTSGQDFFIVKYSPSGSVAWAKSFGDQQDDLAYGIAADQQSNIYVTGVYDSPFLTIGNTTFSNAGGQDMFVLKLDKNGNVIWARNIGGSGNDISNAICIDPHGNPIITGEFNSPVLPFFSGNLVDTSNQTQPFVAKFDSSGLARWARTATGTGGSNGNFGSAVSTDSSSNILVGGGFAFSSITFGTQTLLNSGVTNIFVTKYDSSGNVSWAVSAGGTNEDAATGIGADPGGNVYICGSFNSAKIAFGTTILPNQGFSDVFVAKYSATGDPVWAYGTGGDAIEEARNLSVDPNGFVYVCGSFGSSSISFGSSQLINNGNLNIFLAELSPWGSPLWAKASGGSASDYALSAWADASGNAYIAGYFNSSSLSFGTTSLVATGISNMLVAKITGITGIQTAGTLEETIRVYPNPSSDRICFRFDTEQPLPVVISLGDAYGREVRNITAYPGLIAELPVSDLPAGIYFYTVKSVSHQERGRVVVQPVH
jgi:hypothetical protein